MDETLFDLPADPNGRSTDEGPPGGRPRLQRPRRDEILLRPVDLESLLPADHRARLVWAFVEGLDLSGFHARIRAVEGHAGRPPIDPAILVALWLYATLDGVGSARALDRLCREHDAYRWLAGAVSLNYHTLADFRVEEADLLDGLLVQAVAALIGEGHVTLIRVAHDGVRVRAHAGAGSFRRRERLERALAEAEAQVAALRAELEADPAATSRRVAAARERARAERVERVRRALGALPALEAAKRRSAKKDRRAGEARASTTDHEAHVMRLGDGGYRPAYNAQLTTDTGSGIVVAVTVSDRGSDQGELGPALRRVASRHGVVPAEALADGGYLSLPEIEAAGAAGTRCYIPPPEPRGARERYLPLPTDSPTLAEWRTRMGTPRGQTIYRERAACAEWVNALARNRGLQRLTVCGRAKVRAVLLWFALAHDLLQGLLLRYRAEAAS